MNATRPFSIDAGSLSPSRLLVPIQVTLIVLGWGVVQYPYLVALDLTLSNTAAPDAVLRPILIVLGIGGVLLVPAFWYLYVVFKGTGRRIGRAAGAGNPSQNGGSEQ